MSEIIPAILPKNFEDLKTKLALVAGLVPLVQIDVCDGVFVPSKSWPYLKNADERGFGETRMNPVTNFIEQTLNAKSKQNENIFDQKNIPEFGEIGNGVNAEKDLMFDEDFEKIVRWEEKMPFKNDLFFEIDLMIADPEKEIEKWISVGVKRIVFHYESFLNKEQAMTIFKKVAGRVGIGLAVNVTTPDEKIYSLLDTVDFVQFMGIDKIGFQGQKFDQKVLEKISEFKKEFPNKIVSVDGGVSLENVKSLILAGAGRLVVGSAIFLSGDIKKTIAEFKNLSAI